MFNAGRVFVSWMQNIYSILTQDALMWSHTDVKKVPSDPSTSKAAGNNKSIYYVCLLAWNECTKWLSFQTTCLQVVFVFHAISRDWSIHFDVLHKLLCWSIHALFVDFVLLFCFIIKQQQKLSSFFTQKENGKWTWKAWRWAG